MSEESPEDKKFREAVKIVFAGADGKHVLERLATTYVYPSALRETQELTMYALGQKEFVQRLIDFAKYDKELNVYQE